MKTDQYGIPIKLEIGVYYMIDENTNEVIYDTEEMENELQQQIKKLPKIKIK